MRLEDYLEFQDNPYAIRIRGHRVGLEHIVVRYREGYSPEQIVNDLPTLTLEEVYAAVTYYPHNRPAVDA